MSFKVYLVRHGQTYFNRYNRMQGWSDTPLTEKGIADGKRAGLVLSQIPFDQAYASDRSRAVDTAKYILNENQKSDIPFNQIAGFREASYGFFEGANSDETWLIVGAPYNARTFKELVTNYNMDKTKDAIHEADPFHDAEDAQTYWHRVDAAFSQLRQNSKIDQNILLVSHGTTIRSIVERFDTDQKFDVTQSPLNGSITQLEIDDSTIKVLSYNELTL